MTHLRALLEANRWHELVPDEKSEVVTDGRGRFGAANFVTAAITRDRRLALAYLPAPRAVTIAFAALRGPVEARWFDPTDGTFRAVEGSPFSSESRALKPPGKNSAGVTDWVLLLRSTNTP